MKRRACILRRSSYPGDLLLRREAEALCDAGLDVSVLCVRAPGQARREMVGRVAVHRLPVTSRKGGIGRYLLEYLGFSLLAALRLSWLHLRSPFALIQVNTMPDWLVFATLLPRILGARVSLMVYEPMPELWFTLFRRRLLYRLLVVIQQLCLRYANAVFTVTEQLKQTMVSRGTRADKITVLLNAPEERFFRQLMPASPAPQSDRFVLICHGAIEERYGLDTMLQAIDSLRHEFPMLELRIPGKGSYLDTFLDQVRSSGLQDCVKYLGFVPLPQLVNELLQADAGIVAQKASPYSHLVHTGKMYDYMMFGKPVIASRLRAVNAYFGDDALSFFEPGDADDLARAIRELMQDDALRGRLVHNSQRLYSRYCWQTQLAAYLAVSLPLAGIALPDRLSTPPIQEPGDSHVL